MISNDRTAAILQNTILAMNPDGGGRTTLFADPERSALAPVWSPRGDRIAFTLGHVFPTINGPARADIATISADGTDLRIVTDGASNYALPSWSPDGKQIVYRESRAGKYSLRIVDAESRMSRALLEGPAHYNFPTWSPTGNASPSPATWMVTSTSTPFNLMAGTSSA
jgi:Tol biopolymer transport system component